MFKIRLCWKELLYLEDKEVTKGVERVSVLTHENNINRPRYAFGNNIEKAYRAYDKIVRMNRQLIKAGKLVNRYHTIELIDVDSDGGETSVARESVSIKVAKGGNSI